MDRVRLIWSSLTPLSRLGAALVAVALVVVLLSGAQLAGGTRSDPGGGSFADWSAQVRQAACEGSLRQREAARATLAAMEAVPLPDERRAEAVAVRDAMREAAGAARASGDTAYARELRDLTRAAGRAGVQVTACR